MLFKDVKMKKTILFIFFTTSVYAQSNWKFDAGMFTTPAMNMITFTRYSELSDGIAGIFQPDSQASLFWVWLKIIKAPMVT